MNEMPSKHGSQRNSAAIALFRRGIWSWDQVSAIALSPLDEDNRKIHEVMRLAEIACPGRAFGFSAEARFVS
jgi:hypothetical protein